jgi:hypothetical protein
MHAGKASRPSSGSPAAPLSRPFHWAPRVVPRLGPPGAANFGTLGHGNSERSSAGCRGQLVCGLSVMGRRGSTHNASKIHWLYPLECVSQLFGLESICSSDVCYALDAVPSHQSHASHQTSRTFRRLWHSAQDMPSDVQQPPFSGASSVN